MLRALHKYFGLLATILLLVLTLSGVALSVIPALEKAQAPALLETELNVGTLATRVAENYPGVEQIRRRPSGGITAYYFTDGKAGAVVIDPATGRGLAEYEFSPTVRWLKNLHRSLFLDDGGRLTAATGALAMLILSVSGLFLVARRMGGWRHFFAPTRGTMVTRLHVDIGRFSMAGLIIAPATAIFMTLGTFDLLPQQTANPPFPAKVSGETGLSPAAMTALVDIPVNQMRSLTFPFANDPTDVYSLTTNQGEGFVDQGTGKMLAWQDAETWQKVNEFIYLLHTGQGAWFWGLLLGLMVLGAPVLAITGVLLWWVARHSRPALPKGTTATRADTVILVGSEGGSTWGFASTLMKALIAHGHTVHAAPMSRFDPAKYVRAKQIILLAATYGNGEAPASAMGFIDKLAALEQPPTAKLAVLGFGDRRFPAYCAFAHQVVAQARKKNWAQLLPLDTVDKQSPQDFSRWGYALGEALGYELELVHVPVRPRTHHLKLVNRRYYGQEVQAPTAILRFSLPQVGFIDRLRGRGLKRYEAGDLLGIIPKGSNVPRLYSIASSTRDGFVEICVRKHPYGVCSGQLFDLEIGGEIEGFIRPNPDFRPARNKKPVILIGAGTGIGPLAGFVRTNTPHRPMHLYFGIRHPDSDFLYDKEISDWQSEGKLSAINIAASRAPQSAYVQDLLLRDAAQLAVLIENGAQILVCGGREMAAGVAQALQDILTPHGLEPALLKTEGRYLEDVF